MLKFLEQVRVPTLDLPVEARRKLWFKPFMQSYLVVFIGYLTMYLIRKNFNIAQNDMIQEYGLSMTELGMIGLGFSITYGVGKTIVSYYADGKNTKQFLPLMLILSSLCMLGFSASMGGTGFSQECLVEYCVRRTRGWMIAGGSIEVLKNRIAEGVFGRTVSQRPPAAA